MHQSRCSQSGYQSVRYRSTPAPSDVQIFHVGRQYPRVLTNNSHIMRADLSMGPQHRATGLVDVLDRVLDKGLVVAGDIKISLAEVELLTIRIRLIVCSLDKAQQIGLDWWKYDP